MSKGETLQKSTADKKHSALYARTFARYQLEDVLDESNTSLREIELYRQYATDKEIQYLKHLRTLAITLDKHPDIVSRFGENSSEILNMAIRMSIICKILALSD